MDIEKFLPATAKSKKEVYKHLSVTIDGSENNWRSYEGFFRRDKRLNRKLEQLVSGIYIAEDFDFAMPTDYESIKTNIVQPFESEESEQAYLEYRQAVYNEKIKKNAALVAPKMFTVSHPWFMVMHVSDMHLDDEGADIWLIIDTLSKFEGLPYRIVNGGDNTNNFFKAWAKHIQRESRLTPNDGVKALSIVSKHMQDKLIAGILGNHDSWVDDELGINPYTMIIENYCKNVVMQPEYIIYNVRSSNSDAEYGLSILTHGNVGGRNSKNPHHANTNVYLDMEYKFDRVISGHFHWPDAAISTIPLKSGTFESHLLGSLKGGDSYARGLHLRNLPNPNPFTFTFCLPEGLTFSVDKTNTALMLAKQFQERYG